MENLSGFKDFNPLRENDSRSREGFALTQKNHYNGDKKVVGVYLDYNDALSGFLSKMEEFIKEEWGGKIGNYFGEWFQYDPKMMNKFKNFQGLGDYLNSDLDPGESTFCLVDVQNDSEICELDLLKKMYSKDPESLEMSLPF